MTGAAQVYGQALYELAKDEGRSEEIYHQLGVLSESFRQEPDYLKLLSEPIVSKRERCQLLDEAFRDRTDPYLLNFLKILTEKGHILKFAGCRDAYEDLYFRDHNILSVTVTTAVALDAGQRQRLSDKLSTLTGKTIRLTEQVQPSLLGGVRLDYDGKRLDDTLSHRLSALGDLLKNSVL